MIVLSAILAGIIIYGIAKKTARIHAEGTVMCIENLGTYIKGIGTALTLALFVVVFFIVILIIGFGMLAASSDSNGNIRSI